ncbi:hypothetical protein Pmani_004038 [Petrolisthes manimaculis]|uniref:Uncharacterized protein n=1 Tax=Petrolisthes manimaculis TaxID=1843537 RepID=A0AAE1QEU8_9EUCA|nr:hypothetical protein Pmani_004038 [Petrolisthes manimaculis]
MYMNRDHVMKISLADLNPRNQREFLMLQQVYLGASVVKRTAESPDLCMKKEEMARFQTNCRAFLITAAEQIKKRFDFGDDILSKLAVLDPVNALSNQGYHEQSIVPLAIKLPRIISQDETSLQQLDQEWRRLSIEDLPQHINDMAKKTVKIKYRNPDKFWGTVHTIMDSDGEQKFNTVRE